MKLVGATNWFVRGPFMVEGLLCGALGVAARDRLPADRQGRRACRTSCGHLSLKPAHALAFPITALILLGMGLGARRARLRPHHPPLPARLSDRPSRLVVVEVGRRGRLVARRAVLHAGRAARRSSRRGSATSPTGDLAVVRTGRGRAQRRAGARAGEPDRERPRGAARRDAARASGSSRTTRPSRRIEGRVDLRDLLTYTVDPDTAKDFDDALSFRAEPDGIRAWVHIADVSYFVGAGTPLDHGAMRARVLDVRAGRRRADAAARPGRRPLLAAPERGSPVRDRRAAAERRAALLPLGDPLGRPAHLRAGASGARRRPPCSTRSS